MSSGNTAGGPDMARNGRLIPLQHRSIDNPAGASEAGTRRSKYPTLSVVIPALNESRNIARVLKMLPEGVDEVILVDGHSVDGTAEVARRTRPDVRVVVQNRHGKGNALACGFEACSGDIVVMIDADGSTHPPEIPDFIAKLISGADFVKGSRYLVGGGSQDITRVRRLGNQCLCWLVNHSFGTRYTDLCYGYNAFWRDCLAYLSLSSQGSGTSDAPHWGDGFEIETIMNIRAAVAGLLVAEVPSFERARISGESNLRTIRDGLRVLHAIHVERTRSRLSERHASRQAYPRAPVTSGG